LLLALLINAGMFALEIGFGLKANSSALLADALDFLGDAANYGISLWVLAMGVVARARASLLKAVSMATFGIWVLGDALWGLSTGSVPQATTMGMVGMLALFANLTVAAMLYAWRNGDSNMRSVWLCTRNDAIGNVAVMLAALGVFGTGAGWPDLLVASIMAGLALTAAWQIIRHARQELATAV
jgi:Co/Zn/Cd efflux system component